jgi:hypothetical protein
MAAVALDATAIQALVQAAIIGAMNNLPAAQVPHAVPFAKNPAGAGTDAWDFSSGTGLKIYLASTEGFKTQYDGDQEHLNDFREIFTSERNHSVGAPSCWWKMTTGSSKT